MKDKVIVPAIAANGAKGDGLTLREYFSIMTMQGMIASGADVATTRTAHAHRNEKLAKRAVEVADALIAELSRG